jgi:hypothetical protein
MSLSKKIAAMAGPIAGFAFLLAVPASAQNARAPASPKAETNISTPASESTHKKVEAHRHHWTKKHTPGTAGGTNVSHKPTVAHKGM